MLSCHLHPHPAQLLRSCPLPRPKVWGSCLTESGPTTNYDDAEDCKRDREGSGFDFDIDCDDDDEGNCNDSCDSPDGEDHIARLLMIVVMALVRVESDDVITTVGWW